jgi:hypothetical protein
MSFRTDLAFGHHFEKLASKSITEEIEWAPSKAFKKWDFRTPTTSYEVKADRLAYKYGNAFVEFECSSVPSGIAASEADIWFYFMVRPDTSYECYKIPRKELLEFCKGCVVKAGGDGYRAKGYIIPLTDLKNYRVTLQTTDNKSALSPPEEHPLHVSVD